MTLFYGLVRVTLQLQRCFTSLSQAEVEVSFRALGRVLEGSGLHTLRVLKQSGTILWNNYSPFIKRPLACYGA